MRVDQEPADPMRYALTLSGQRVHLTIPVPYHSLTLCREVVYRTVGAAEVTGRQICTQCAGKAPR